MTFVVRIAFNSEVNIERISNDDKIITVALASHVMTCNVPFLLWVPYITSYFIFQKSKEILFHERLREVP